MTSRPSASPHTAHAHHHPGHIHPPAATAMSLLRLSAWQRLGIAAVLAALLWLAAYWAL
jgi:hypothetical protein